MIGVVVIFLFAIFSFTGLWDDDVLPTVLARSSIILWEENWAGKACTREKSTTCLDSGHIFCEWERCACARPVEPQRIRKNFTYRRNPSKQKVQLLIFTQRITSQCFHRSKVSHQIIASNFADYPGSFLARWIFGIFRWIVSFVTWKLKAVSLYKIWVLL